MKRTHQRALAQLDLEFIVLSSFRLGESGLGGRICRRVAERLAIELFFCLTRTPRFGRNATQRDTRLFDLAIIKFERDRRRGEREFIGFPIPDLEEERAPRPVCLRYDKSRDQLALCERGLNVWGISRRLVQFGEGNAT